MRTATINESKRPVSQAAITLAALIGLVLHFLAPFFALGKSIKRAQAKGRISYSSPIGEALFGHKIGEIVTAQSPAGPIQFKILEIQ